MIKDRLSQAMLLTQCLVIFRFYREQNFLRFQIKNIHLKNQKIKHIHTFIHSVHSHSGIQYFYF